MVMRRRFGDRRLSDITPIQRRYLSDVTTYELQTRCSLDRAACKQIELLDTTIQERPQWLIWIPS